FRPTRWRPSSAVEHLSPKAERERWLLSEEEALRERGIDPVSRGYHVLGSLQWAYWRRLLRIAGDRGW
ncbi:unnamed protein product, partial [Ascophyllum nodosum]